MDFTFAELLRSYRTRASLAQGALAAAIHIHRNTLSGWERGQYLPRERELVLRLAEELALSPTEREQFLQAAGLWVALDPVAPPTSRHQLRAPVADFVGRAREIDQLLTAMRRTLAQECGAIISGVQGMGGIGKTELAYVIAHQLRDAFPDAQIVLNLRGSSATPLTPEQTLQAVIQILTPDAKLPGDLPALEQRYRSLLYRTRMLILADDACDAAQVQALLPPAGSAVLITSRQRFTLPGMATAQLEHLRADEAVALLRAICPRLDEAEAQMIARACGHLPLALRISGSILHTIPALPVLTYIARLGDERQRLRALHDPDDPNLNVEASLRLSYAQLEAAAQQVFRQRGVMVADFATELAQAVVEAAEGVEVEATLQLLLRRNLVMYDAEHGRWRLHDLMRDLARNMLEAAGEAKATWWRYARATVQVAQATQEQYEAGGDGMLAALARFDVERAHIGAGRRWAMEQAGTTEGDRLLVDNAVATYYIGMLRYDVRRERIPQWEHTLVATRRLRDRRAERGALSNLGNAYIDLGEAERAIPAYEQALTIARAIGDQCSQGITLNSLGMAYAELGEVRRAIPCYEQCLTIVRATGDRRTEGKVLSNLGNAYIDLGEAERAIPAYEQALTIFRAIGARRGEGIVLNNLGLAYVDLGEVERAIPAYEQALTIARAIGGRRGEGYALLHLGQAYAVLGDTRRAIDSCIGTVTIACEIGNRRLEGYALSHLAHAQAWQGDLACATTSFDQAMALFRAVSDRHGEAECQWLFGLVLAQQGERERSLSLLRAAVAYEEEIGHAKAAEHAALLVRLEAGEDLPAELLHPTRQRAVEADGNVPPEAAQP